jgi:hypothetical protein
LERKEGKREGNIELSKQEIKKEKKIKIKK